MTLTCKVSTIACKPIRRLFVLARAWMDDAKSTETEDGALPGQGREAECRGGVHGSRVEGYLEE